MSNCQNYRKKAIDIFLKSCTCFGNFLSSPFPTSGGERGEEMRIFQSFSQWVGVVDRISFTILPFLAFSEMLLGKYS